MEEKIKALQDENARLQQEVTDLRQKLDTANSAYAYQLEVADRYKEKLNIIESVLNL